jgi:hypothetical protein
VNTHRLGNLLKAYIRKLKPSHGWVISAFGRNFSKSTESKETIDIKEEHTIFGGPKTFRTMSVNIHHEEIKKIIQSETGFRIRISNQPGFTRPAALLVTKRYTDRGYPTPSLPDDPGLFTFLAYSAGEVVGTVGIRIDTTSHGLASDKKYKNELADLRKQGHRPSEFTRLAVDTGIDSEVVLANLFHAAYLWAGVLHDSTYCVIEVTTRHAKFYERMFGFKRIGGETIHDISKVKVVILGIKMDEIKTILETMRVSDEGSHLLETSSNIRRQQFAIFKYAFTEVEEMHILAALRKVKERNNALAVAPIEVHGLKSET